MTLPPEIKRVIAGKKAKSGGDEFERQFARAASLEGYDVEKLPLGARQYAQNVLKRVPMPFDFIICRKGKAVFLDTKTTESNTFIFSAIKEHQLNALLRKERAGCLGGYVVYFRTLNRIIFFPAWKLATVRRLESLKPEDGMDLGTIFEMKIGRLTE